MQLEHFQFLCTSAVKQLIATCHTQSILRTEISNPQPSHHTSNVYWKCYESARISISTAWSSGILFQSTVLHSQGGNIVHINTMIMYIARICNNLIKMSLAFILQQSTSNPYVLRNTATVLGKNMDEQINAIPGRSSDPPRHREYRGGWRRQGR